MLYCTLIYCRFLSSKLKVTIQIENSEHIYLKTHLPPTRPTPNIIFIRAKKGKPVIVTFVSTSLSDECKGTESIINCSATNIIQLKREGRGGFPYLGLFFALVHNLSFFFRFFRKKSSKVRPQVYNLSNLNFI